MRKAAAAVAALTLSGCASPFFRPEMSGNETHVRIDNVEGSEKALQMATDHCRQYGKTPKLVRGGAYAHLFDCV